jgi:FecR-like protein
MPEPDLEQLFAAWRSEPLPELKATPAAARAGNAAVAEALRQVARRRQRQQQLRRVGLALALAAGVVGVLLGGWFGLVGSPRLAERGGLSAPRLLMLGRAGDVNVTDATGHGVDASSDLAEGYAVRTKQGSVTLGFPSGAAAQVASGSALKLTAAGGDEAFFLEQGRVEIEVPKLGAGHGFFVQTPDARVTVHGTHFSVDVEATTLGPRTRVSVTHGIVSVQQAGREVRLTAGQAWPAEETPPSPPPPAASADAGAANEGQGELDRPRRRARGSARQRSVVAGAESRELAEQNQWFARAMTLKKNGAPEAALAELNALSKRYPRTPLAQELRVERLRLLQSLGHVPQAVREARRYLRAFPHGYAVREARELLDAQR